jgi:hypothetical protein
MLMASAQNAQDSRNAPQDRPAKPAETKLVGVNILDTGLSVIGKFGSPDEVQPLSIGGGGVGPGGGPGAAGGRGGVGGPAGGGSGPTMAPGGLWNGPGAYMLGDPFGQVGGAAERPPGVDANGFGPPGNAGGNIGNPNAGAGGGAAGGADDRILFTRWVYNQGASRYAFVMDKFNRVVQIEAIGMSDSKVRTSRGIKFGSTFADVIKAYNAPDAYEITGDNIVVRYLVRDHVAFRLAKLKAKDVHRVTGIVVAAGKS